MYFFAQNGQVAFLLNGSVCGLGAFWPCVALLPICSWVLLRILLFGISSLCVARPFLLFLFFPNRCRCAFSFVLVCDLGAALLFLIFKV